MCGLGDVESVGTNVQGQEENTDTGQGLESSKALLHTYIKQIDRRKRTTCRKTTANHTAFCARLIVCMYVNVYYESGSELPDLQYTHAHV